MTTTETKNKKRKKVGAAWKAYLLGLAQQRWADSKERLFDDYDYDRISRREYDRMLKEAHQDYCNEVKRIKKL